MTYNTAKTVLRIPFNDCFSGVVSPRLTTEVKTVIKTQLKRYSEYHPWGGILRPFYLCFKSVLTNRYSEHRFNSVVTFVLTSVLTLSCPSLFDRAIHCLSLCARANCLRK